MELPKFIVSLFGIAHAPQTFIVALVEAMEGTPKIRCHQCGYQSTNLSFFRRELTPVLRLGRQYCYGCGPYAPTRKETRSYFNCVILLVAGLLMSRSHSRDLVQFATILSVCGVIASLSWVVVLAHELGHAFAALVAGLHVQIITIGTGSRLYSCRLGGAEFRVNCFLLTGGFVRVYAPSDSVGRLPCAFYLSGGVFANALVCYLLFQSIEVWRNLPVVYGGVAGFVVVNALMVVVNLAPRNISLGYSSLQSDGAKLLSLFRSAEIPDALVQQWYLVRVNKLIKLNMIDDAHDLLVEARKRYPSAALLLGMFLYVVYRKSGYLIAVQSWLDVQDQHKSSDDITTAFLLAMATCVIAGAKEKELFPMAEGYIEKVMKYSSQMPLVDLAQGALLLEKGEIAEAGLRIQSCVRAIQDPQEKTEYLPYLIQVEQQAGRETNARELETLVAYLNKSISRHKLATLGQP